MSEKYKLIDSTLPTFITLTLVGWVDLFIRPVYSELIDKVLNYCVSNKRLQVHGYVYMTSHLHLILSSVTKELQNIIRDFKKFTPLLFKVWETFERSPNIPPSFRGKIDNLRKVKPIIRKQKS